MKRLTYLFCALMMLTGAQVVQAAKTYDLKISDYEPEYFKQNNDVYMLMHTEDEAMAIRLDIIVEEGQQFFTNGKTYTWEDMMHPYCYAYVRDEYKEYKFADATFTWRLDELGLEHIAGSATDSLGNIYNFHYDVLPYIPTGDTIEMTFTHSLHLEHDGEWYFSGTEGEYYVLFTLINEGNSPVGHYDAQNIDIEYSYIDRPAASGEHEIFLFHHAEIDIIEAGDDTLKIEALVAAMDTQVYRLHMFYLEPKPMTRKTITATNLYINTDYLYGMIGAFQVEASNDDHYIKMAFTPMTDELNIYDTYLISTRTPNMGYVTDYSQSKEDGIEIYQGTITISKTDNSAVLTGTILCYDNTEYTLDLSYVVPEKTREEDLNIDGLTLHLDQGAWRISGYNADKTQFVSLVLNDFGIEGTYDFVKTSPLYSYLVTDITWQSGEVESYLYYELRDANLTVSLNPTDSVVTITGTMLMQRDTDPRDVPLYNVQLRSQAATEAVENLRTNTSATKRLENGQIVIEKNGVKYTVTGNVIGRY